MICGRREKGVKGTTQVRTTMLFRAFRRVALNPGASVHDRRCTLVGFVRFISIRVLSFRLNLCTLFSSHSRYLLSLISSRSLSSLHNVRSVRLSHRRCPASTDVIRRQLRRGAIILCAAASPTHRLLLRFALPHLRPTQVKTTGKALPRLGSSEEVAVEVCAGGPKDTE